MVRGKRTRVEEGIYRDVMGLSATVKVGAVQRERRFPLDTPREELRTWRTLVRAQLTEDQRHEPRAMVADPSPRGTLAADIARYAKLLEARPSYQAERAHLRAWEPLYGPRRRAYLRPEDVTLAIAGWQTEGVAAQTIIHRCRVLRQLYHALDGPQARTPVDGVRRPAKPKGLPHIVPMDTMLAVRAKLETADLFALARFDVLASTGQRPSQVMRAQPGDVDLKRGIWLVRPAKGSEPRELFLNRDMRAAWKTFIARNCWGPYDATAFARLLRRCGWPRDVRPYNLRHTFAVAALEHGVDLGDVQGLLGHSEIETTRAFYAPILESRLKAASAKLDGWYSASLSSRGASKSASRSRDTGSSYQGKRGVRSKTARGRNTGKKR